jgi:hypothetical protein
MGCDQTLDKKNNRGALKFVLQDINTCTMPGLLYSSEIEWELTVGQPWATEATWRG